MFGRCQSIKCFPDTQTINVLSKDTREINSEREKGVSDVCDKKEGFWLVDGGRGCFFFLLLGVWPFLCRYCR